jgi:hypothetical protein
VLAAQDASGSPASDFGVRGSAAVEYRFTDVRAPEPQFLQLFDLQKERLQDFNVLANLGAAEPVRGQLLTVDKRPWRRSFFNGPS